MTDKMKRFLSSINIEDIDAFDLEFEMIGRNRFNNQQWDMVISKETPWEYPLLRSFIDALNNIKYPYMLMFTYKKSPTFDDLNNLFVSWHQSIYHLPPDCILKDGDSGFYKAYFKTDEAKKENQSMLNDFKDFLKFINYDFVLSEILIDEENLNIKEPIENAFINDTKNDSNDDSLLETDNKENDKEVSNADDEVIEVNQAELNQEVESKLLEQMKYNALQMKKERERARLNKRGSYIPIDNIDSITETSGSVDFSGTIFSVDVKEFGSSKRFNIGVNDDEGGCIFVNMYENSSLTEEIISNLKRGTNIRVRGVSYVEERTKNLVIKGHYINLLPPEEIEKEPYELNRVELHLHTKMSNMDAVNNMEDYCAYAQKLGHKAIAITDHAVVQNYPNAQKAAKDFNMKVLYGSELYLVNDKIEYIKNPCDRKLSTATYVVLDLETTGLSSRYDDIIEFGAVKVVHGMVTSSIDILINPKKPLSEKIIEITHISDDLLKDKPTINEVIGQIVDFIGDSIIVTHNANFDISFLQESLKRLGLPLLTNPIVDTLALSRYLFPDHKRHNLGSLCRNMDVYYDEDSAHRADYDAKVLNDVWQPMIVVLTKNNPNITHADLEKLETSKEILKHIKPTHATVLVKNKKGLKDLYKLISLSHIDFLSDVPKVPISKLNEFRKDLLVGSACFNGNVFETARYYNKERLKEAISFFDYIEIQPKENYSFLVDMKEISEEQEEQFLKDIVECADELNIPVVATGDVHYCRPKDKIFRDVYISAKGLGGTNHPLNPYSRSKYPHFENPNQHYRTTKEMLDAMSFLGEEKAYEITVTNTNKIADQIESIVPLPNDVLYTPEIENCEQMLKDMVFDKAHELYGDPLPTFIQERLDTELNGIISNGYSVIYYIAHKIVKKTTDDGYIVGSRGSVGSSLVATMAGITEVNALPPHYRCCKCKHLEFTSETMPSYKSGYDLPEKRCPVCGEIMVHDGQNIPFETFLGFSAEKTPDIDLNFPHDYQARAHDYTKELLGADNVFRAGTISGVQEKIAFGYARGYIERQGFDPNTFSKAKLDYLTSGCVDVKRTTGQHPGGIVVIPKKYDVYDFTPIQYPADEPNSSWKTTHFDFRSIHDTILKLDMLGHVDPVALKMMCDLTNIKLKDIPLNDKKVLSLFSSPKALEMEDDYTNAKTGALAIPEFGTDFVRGILESTKPTTFADLVIISGISHGTDVWQGNAETLIKNGTATLQTVIGCRDDIMSYLISMGVPKKDSFAIMERVRKGKGLTPEFEAEMKSCNVPDYYIDSCKKIKYLFPKGHAVAYVTMAIRVGYFKIYYPLEFYATFFSTRSDKYDIVPMIGGKKAIINRLEELKFKAKTEKLTNKEIDQEKTLYIALEMAQRGFKILNIDLNKSDGTKFIVDHERKALIPPFICLDGLGESVASSIIEARNEKPFYSKEDLLRRTKLSSTNVNDLDALGVLEGLTDTDQLSLFDF